MTQSKNMFSGHLQPDLRRLKAISKFKVSTILLLSSLVVLLLTQPVLAVDENTDDCSIERGIISSDNAFTMSVTGSDFKLTCSGQLSDKLTNESIEELLDFGPGFVAGTSKILLDLKGLEGEITSVSLHSDAALNIVTGTITTDADTEKGYRSVTFGSSDASNPINVENQATITAKGAGTRALVVRNGHGGDATLTNHGTVVAEGEPYTRPDTDHPYRRGDAVVMGVDGSGSGNIMLTNRGSVATKGQGGRGLSATIDKEGSGNAIVHNYGTVKTEGDPWTPDKVRNIETQKYRAYGVFSSIEGGGHAEVINQLGGSITTMGAEARGLFAFSGGPTGTATAINYGTVTTHGSDARGVSGNTEGQNGATVTVTNEGTITTHGEQAHGLYTYAGRAADYEGDEREENFSSQSTVSARNTGTITTSGDNADGAAIYGPISLDPLSQISIFNSGTVTTNGVSADGFEAGFLAYITEDSDASGKVLVENVGTVTVNGDGPDDGWSIGLSGFYWANTNSESGDSGGNILNSGDVVMQNSGTINAVGHRSIGINASTLGIGTSTINIRGGVVTAGSSGDSETETGKKFGIGVRGISETDSTSDDESDDVDVLILVSGSSVIRAFGATADDSATSDYNETMGIGIEANTGAATGHSVVTISDGSSVTADDGYAVMFVGGQGTLNLDGATLVGDTMFTDQDDTFNVMESGGSITGQIDFGGGEDEMVVNVAKDQNFTLNGDIIGLETLNKTGAGLARFGGDVTFQGSTLSLEQGVLVIAGHMNLGTGEVTIEKAGKLTFEIDGSGNTGSMTADSVHFEGVSAEEVSVHTQISEDVDDDSLDEVRASIASKTPVLLNAGTITSGSESSPVTVTSLSLQSESADGSVMNVGTVQGDTGAAAFIADRVKNIARTSTSDTDTEDPSTETEAGAGDTATTASGGSSNSSNVILGVGLLAILVAYFTADDDGSAGFSEYYFDKPQSAYITSVSDRGVLTIRESGKKPYQLWIRTSQVAPSLSMTGVNGTGVNGTEVGMSLYSSDNVYFDASIAPNVAAEVGSLNLAAKGEVYSLSSGWRNDRYFGGLRLSHGEFEVNSIVDNPIVNSALISNAKLRNTQAQLRAGMNLGTGALRFTPSASVQVGTYENSEHVADSPALEATIPSYAQDYTSVQLGLKMTSEKWLSFTNGSKWKPQLKFDSIHTDSKDAGSLTLRQSDKAGALSFNTNAGLRSMPDVVNSMSFGAKVKSSANDQAEWKFGFAGLEADGEEYYAAMAAYQLKF